MRERLPGRRTVGIAGVVTLVLLSGVAGVQLLDDETTGPALDRPAPAAMDAPPSVVLRTAAVRTKRANRTIHVASREPTLGEEPEWDHYLTARFEPGVHYDLRMYAGEHQRVYANRLGSWHRFTNRSGTEATSWTYQGGIGSLGISTATGLEPNGINRTGLAVVNRTEEHLLIHSPYPYLSGESRHDVRGDTWFTVSRETGNLVQFVTRWQERGETRYVRTTFGNVGETRVVPPSGRPHPPESWLRDFVFGPLTP